MKFLADESCGRSVILVLRDAGHDVLSIAETSKGITDEEVLARAVVEQRILITEDHDFGELVYAHSRSTAGVILVRIDSRARSIKPATVLGAINKLGARLANAFTVVQPGRVRVSDRP